MMIGRAKQGMDDDLLAQVLVIMPAMMTGRRNVFFRPHVTIKSVNCRGIFMTSYTSTPRVTRILLSARPPEYPHSMMPM